MEFASEGGSGCVGAVEGAGGDVEGVCDGGGVCVGEDGGEGVGVFGLCETGGEWNIMDAVLLSRSIIYCRLFFIYFVRVCAFIFVFLKLLYLLLLIHN